MTVNGQRAKCFCNSNNSKDSLLLSLSKLPKVSTFMRAFSQIMAFLTFLSQIPPHFTETQGVDYYLRKSQRYISIEKYNLAIRGAHFVNLFSARK